MQLVNGNTPAEPDEFVTCPYFATDRTKNPVCLELRLADGRRKALPYSYITGINFDADAGIEIITTLSRIAITGRNLASLFDHLVMYRVRYVQADMGQDAQEDGVFVEEILIEAL